jgi:hypothetical protein
MCRIGGCELDSSDSSKKPVVRSCRSGDGIVQFHTLQGISLPGWFGHFEISENVKDAADNMNVCKEDFYSKS